MRNRHYVNINEFVGHTFTHIIRANADQNLLFITDDGAIFNMHHEQECCEHVYLADVCGSLDDLCFSPILTAEARIKRDSNDCESSTWTFYELATMKGYVTLRWYGESNGYYSEGVDIEKLSI